MRSEEEPTHRLHPLSLLFHLGGEAWRFLGPALLVVVFSRPERGLELFLVLAFIPAAAAAAFRYVTFRYRFTGDDLVIHRGLFFRSQRHIPFGRIQNIDVTQNPLHRLLGVAEARLETGSGEETEAAFRVLSMPAIEAMRRRVFANRATAPPGSSTLEPRPVAAAEEPHEVLRLGPASLFLYGVLSNRGVAVVGAAVGILWEWQGGTPEGPLQPVPALGFDVHSPWMLALMLLGALILLRLFSVGWAFVHLYGFTLRRRGEDLQTRFGLWTRSAATIPRHRIQMLSIHQRWLQRLLGRCAVRADTAGGAGREDVQVGRAWIAPIVREADLDRLLQEVLPEVRLGDVTWLGVDARGKGRIFRRYLIVLAPFFLAGGISLGAWALAPFALVTAGAYALARLRASRLGYALTDRAVFSRSGWWGRHVSIVRFAKIQAVTVQESPFDRRLGMATLRVDTAARWTAGHPFRIPFLPRDEAMTMLGRLGREAARTELRW